MRGSRRVTGKLIAVAERAVHGAVAVATSKPVISVAKTGGKAFLIGLAGSAGAAVGGPLVGTILAAVAAGATQGAHGGTVGGSA